MNTLSNYTVPTLLDRFFGDVERSTQDQRVHSPDIEIWKGEREYRVRAEVPGYRGENVNVSVENGYLNISGQLPEEKEAELKLVHSEIRSYREFRRALRIDESKFDVDAVEAKLENGLLEIVLPLNEKTKPRQIQVKG